MTARPSAQHGATLVVALIFLILMSLFAASAFRSSGTNLRVVGNMEARQEAVAAAQVALEQTLSAPTFSTNPDNVAANPVLVDIDNNGSTDYTVRLQPRPTCYRANAIRNDQLNPDLPGDIACMKSGVVTTGGIETEDPAGATGDSMCAETEWNLRAEVTDDRTGARVAVNQGAAIRVLETDAANACK